MKVRSVDDNVKNLLSSRTFGLWPALTLSILGHGLLLYGLSKGFGHRSPSDFNIADEPLWIQFQTVSSHESSEVVIDVSEQVSLSSPDTQVDQAEILGQQAPNIKAQGSSVDVPKEESFDPTQLYGPPSPSQLQSETTCLGQRQEDIPDVGQSNLVGRRKEDTSCEQG